MTLLTEAKKTIRQLLDALNMPVTDSSYVDRQKQKEAAVEAGENVIKAIERTEK